MLSIARSELVQIFRNRLVLLMSIVMPVALSAFFVYMQDRFGGIGTGYTAAITVVTVGAFALYGTVVTTLASRRQNLFLKRLRSTAASDVAILSGLVLPVVAITVVQATVVLTVLALVTDGPRNVVLVAVTVVSSIAMLLGLGLATAGLTNSPEHAQVTTLPVIFGTIGVAAWVGITGTDNLALLKRLLPGGSATEMMVNAWNGGVPVTESLALLAPTLAWVVVAVLLARRLFRWEPRH